MRGEQVKFQQIEVKKKQPFLWTFSHWSVRIANEVRTKKKCVQLDYRIKKLKRKKNFKTNEKKNTKRLIFGFEFNLIYVLCAVDQMPESGRKIEIGKNDKR